MKPPPFEYADPESLSDAVSLLAAHEGEAKLLAGGQSLMPLLNMRLARPGVLVDLRRVRDLAYIREHDHGIAIGAMTTQRDVERSDTVRQRLPVLHSAMRFIAHPQIRNRGTFGGSLAHADPAAECPAIAVALDAEFKAVGPKGERSIGAADFFLTYLTTALEPTEILTEVRLPALAERTGWSFMEIARRHGDYALAGIVATLGIAADGRCSGARIVLFGVGSTPVRAPVAEQVIVGEQPGDAVFEQAAKKVGEAVDDPLTDVHASGEFRRHLAQVLTRRALAEAARRARAT